LGPSTWHEGLPLRLGLPEPLEFFGDTAMETAHLKARTKVLDSLGATSVPVDLTPFLDAGALLYQGAWVAERYADLGPFFETHPSSQSSSINPTVRQIIESGARFSAAELFRTQHALRNLRHAVRPVWDQVDVLVLPTIGTTFTIDEVLADPIARNSVLGHYTHFANLLDLAAIAIPAGLTEDGRPSSLMLIGPPGSDLTLATVAQAVLS
jgi:Asp-tRNA(Asn)/Glu-tRNA(Gln) amidotransferase A subunit family amidase